MIYKKKINNNLNKIKKKFYNKIQKRLLIKWIVNKYKKYKKIFLKNKKMKKLFKKNLNKNSHILLEFLGLQNILLIIFIVEKNKKKKLKKIQKKMNNDI